jgi:hypothetical protein
LAAVQQNLVPNDAASCRYSRVVRRIDDNESSIRTRSSVVSAIFAGIVGPLILLLSAVGVEWRTALTAGLGIVVLMIAGASLLLLLGLERVASSSAGFFVIGGAVSWGLIAALSQLFGVVVSRNHAWIPGLLLCCIGLVSSRHRVSFVSALRRSPDSLDREIVPLWVAILAILGVSDWSFAALAIAIGGVHWVLSLTGLVGWCKRTGFVVLWALLIVFRISTQLLGWRVSPWAFSLGSLDNHIWVAGAWAYDQFGWTADPTTSGVESSYHFLGQAMAGAMARLTGIEVVASVGILLPVMLSAAAFFSMRTVFGAWTGVARYWTWLPVLVLLAAFSPLEPNSPFSMESFTHLVSVGFFCVLLAALAVSSLGQSRRVLAGLTLLVLLIGLAKVFTGAIAIGVMLVVSVTHYLRGDHLTAKSGLRHAGFAGALLMILYSFVYARTSSSTVFSMKLGFGTLDYRYGLVGGPSIHSVVSALLLMLLFWPFWFGANWVFRRFHERAVMDGYRATSMGFLLAAVGLAGLSLLLDFPPAGYAERYFSSVGIILALTAGLACAADDIGKGVGTRLSRFTQRSLLIPVVVIVGIASSTLLWVQRLQGWPSSRRFVLYYLVPSVPFLLIALGVAIASQLRSRAGHRSQLKSPLAAVVFFALAIHGASTNVGYALRGPLNTFAGYAAGRVSGADLVAEVKESGDRTATYRGLLDFVKKLVPASAIIASNANTELQLLIASDSQRQLWWSSYIEDLARIDKVLTSHLRWRGDVIHDFAARPSVLGAREMRSCGVTHFVLDTAGKNETSSVQLPQGVNRVFEDDRYVILELDIAPVPETVPEKQWLRWCTSKPSV